MSSQGFPQSRRLANATEIKRVVRRGRRYRTHKLDIRWLRNDLGHARLGLVVPRYGATAVARNKLRRRLREIARRRLLPHIGPMDLVVRARPSAYRSDVNSIGADLDRWLESLAS